MYVTPLPLGNCAEAPAVPGRLWKAERCRALKRNERIKIQCKVGWQPGTRVQVSQERTAHG